MDTTTTATRQMIRNLRTEAGGAGDLEQVALCDAALNGSPEAWAACQRAIGDALAMRISAENLNVAEGW